MLSLFLAAPALNVGAYAAPRTSRAAVNMATLSDFSASTLGGEAVDMSKYKGKPVLIVNVASL